MLNKIVLLIHNQWIKQRKINFSQGFTLIELLVALVISSIIISSLLTFMVNILTTDRREQAKAQSEQELQAATDYIARDLEQAVYVYDRKGLEAITGNYNTTLCTSAPTTTYQPPGGCSQIPPTSATRVPVLAFWKREILPAERSTNVNNQPNPNKIGCLVQINNFANGQQQCNNQDYPVYSLVVYYLNREGNQTWSEAARITRFQIRDGIPSTDTPHRDGNRSEVDPVSGNTSTPEYDLQPSKGFMPFNLKVSGSSLVHSSDLNKPLQDKMNRWQKHADAYDIAPVTLIDYIDNSTDTNEIPLPNATLTDPNTVDDFCDSVSATAQLVPDYSNTAIDNSLKTGSFYACVDSGQNITRVFLRGNAYARFDRRQMEYKDSQAAFFPTSELQIQGRGFISAN